MKNKKLLIISTSILLAGITLVLLIKKYKSRIKCNSSVLFLGNSQTANNNSYVEKLSKYCNNSFTKIAKAGAKSDWILEKYKEQIGKGNKYDWISVMIGGNDIFARKSIDKTKSNLTQLFQLAKQNKSKILVISSPSKLNYYKTDPQHLALANELEKWLKRNKLITKYISISKETENPSYMASDNLHLNNSGQNLVYSKVLKNIS